MQSLLTPTWLMRLHQTLGPALFVCRPMLGLCWSTFGQAARQQAEADRVWWASRFRRVSERAYREHLHAHVEHGDPRARHALEQAPTSAIYQLDMIAKVPDEGPRLVEVSLSAFGRPGRPELLYHEVSVNIGCWM